MITNLPHDAIIAVQSITNVIAITILFYAKRGTLIP